MAQSQSYFTLNTAFTIYGKESLAPYNLELANIMGITYSKYNLHHIWNRVLFNIKYNLHHIWDRVLFNIKYNLHQICARSYLAHKNLELTNIMGMCIEHPSVGILRPSHPIGMPIEQ